MSPVRFTDTITVVQGDGGGGPNPTDAFTLAVYMTHAETVPGGNDAVAFAFGFPDTIPGQSEAVLLGLTYPDTVAAVADALLSLGLGVAETLAVQEDLATLLIRLTLADALGLPIDGLTLGIAFPADEVPAQTDALTLGLPFADSVAALAEGLALRITWAEAFGPPDEALKLGLPFDDTVALPTDARSGLAKLWGTGSAGTGVTSPANADGINNGTLATVTTTVANPATETLQTNVTQAPGSTTPFTSVVLRCWYRLQTTLSSSTAKLVLHSGTAAFSDITVETLSAVAGDNNHLTTPLTLDVSATVNTIAKVKSCQFLYTTIDAAAGVSPAIITVDASSIELTGAL